MTESLEHDWDRDSVEFLLTEESVVIELGGYKGRWASVIATRNNPRVYAFEPQKWAFEQLQEALLQFPNARAFNFALGTSNGTFEMSDWGTDGCSFVKPSDGKPTGMGEMREIKQFFELEGFDEIDVLMMNIEGYEFTLIPYMLRHKLFERVRHFICQFHPRDETDRRHYWQIRDALGQHRLVRFNYGTTLTCWDRL